MNDKSTERHRLAYQLRNAPNACNFVLIFNAALVAAYKPELPQTSLNDALDILLRLDTMADDYEQHVRGGAQ